MMGSRALFAAMAGELRWPDDNLKSSLTGSIGCGKTILRQAVE
jgi:hypothetical protein